MKPYVKQLFTPGGVQILRDSVPDHKHHHGLMFAIRADGVNFWEEVDKCGRELPDKFFKAAEADQSLASLAQKLNWLTPDGRQVLKERRSIEVHIGRDIPATLLTWHTSLKAAGKKPVNLTGAALSRTGYAVRAVDGQDRPVFQLGWSSGNGRPRHRAGDTGEVVRLHVAVGDKPVTVAMFDHPQNTRPARFFTMSQPFSYLAATINVWKEPLELKPGKTLDLRYGVALWDGETDRQAVEKLYRKWLQLEPER